MPHRLVRRLLPFVLAPAFAVALQAADREVLNFNPDWRFVKADPAGAEQPAFDDHGWEQVSTPHTFNDTDTFDNWSTPGHRGEQIQWSGLTWYRKTFAVPAGWAGKAVFVEFEAVRQIAEVYLNGHRLGVCKTGFTPFGFELTPFLQPGRTNVLAVRVDNRFMRDPLDPATAAEIAQRNGVAAAARPASTDNPNLRALSHDVNERIPDQLEDLAADQIPWNNPHWHPAHGGIYRNVRLIVTDPLHITLPLYSFLQSEGPYAYATDITATSARVGVEIPIRNDRDTHAAIDVRAEIVDAQDNTVLTLSDKATVASHANRTVKLAGALSPAQLWEPAYPYLYRVVCTVTSGGTTIDSTTLPLGIRAVRWDAAHGFFINGNPLKLHGWGQKPTDEWPGLGAALPDWLHVRTLELMKEAGGNYVRWGHTPAGPAQISAADALGIVTLQPGLDGESDTVRAAWTLRAGAFRDLVIYFRNHPSILIWEGGNQKVTREHAAELRGAMDRYDPHGGRAYTHRRSDKTTAEFMDIVEGTEGGREIPWLPVIEGEYDREESPRRVWDDASPPNFGYPEAKGMTYQLTSEQFAVNEIAQYRKISAPDHCGGANWIFSDSTSGGRVPAEVARASGEVDGVRLPKEAYFVTSVLFRPDPQVHIIGHWTYPAGTQKTIRVASNLDDVELFLNGRSLGHGERSQTYRFTFPKVAFAPGELKAVGSRAGRSVVSHVLHTAGEPVSLRLTALTAPQGWQADGQDVALIDVEAVDAAGERCPTVEQRVDFETTGPAVWRGGYNSGKLNSVNHPWLDLECGVNRVALRSMREAGTVTVRASAKGLREAAVTLTLADFPARDGMSARLPAPPATLLPASAPRHPAFHAAGALIKATTTKDAALAGVGRYVRNFNYTGPQSAIVHVEVNARDGGIVYVDRDFTFRDLPKELAGADWVQLADADQRYSAVDLIELAVKAGSIVTIAHDTGIPPPAWLREQYRATERTITVQGRALSLFERRIESDQSLTLGSNADGSTPPAGLMYVVFVNAAP